MFFLFLLAVGSAKAQQGANIYSGDTLRSSQKKLMLIPFDPLLYNSEIDRDIAAKHNLKFDEIRMKFRTDLDFHIGLFLKSKYHVVAPLREKDEAIQQDLQKIYSGIAFNYVPLKTAEKGKKEKANRSEIRNGQLVDVDNSGPKYMSTVVKNADLLPEMNSKYGTEYYLFITQFEIRNDMSDQLAITTGQNSRYVMVHYNIVDQSSKHLSGGIAKVLISNREYDMKNIANSAFREVAEQIMSSIPTLEKK